MGAFFSHPIPAGRFRVRHKPDSDRPVDSPSGVNVAQRRWVVTGKLEDGGGGEWLRESKRNRIRDRSEKY